MSKNIIITWVVVIIAIIILVFLGWWFLGKTNSATIQPNVGASKVKSSEKSIASFKFSELDVGANEVIDNIKHTVTLILPSKTNITKLTPIISLPNHATVSPNSGVIQNFTKPINYIVTAEDGSTQSYAVTVETATPEGTGGS